jgi:hypothetical protein
MLFLQIVIVDEKSDRAASWYLSDLLWKSRAATPFITKVYRGTLC